MCITDMRPRWVVFFRGPCSFSVKFSEVYEALDSIIRAESIGYKAKMVMIPR